MTDLPLLPLVRSILAQPTAPFHEDAVRGELLQQLAQCPHVASRIDAFGNIIAHYHRGVDSVPRFALAAHMDHPGYVGGEFLGGVPDSYLEKRPAVRDFGAFSMWDLPACEVIDGRIHSRACDDLIGCAAIVATMQALEHSAAECSVFGLFTRTEEVGFVGAIQLAKSGDLPRDITVISLECSSEKGGQCRMGDGAILRVGDRTSIFDPAITAIIADLAKAAGISVQRCLMSGGTCEATAYQLYGYLCGALCVALGNYHNCAPDGRIDTEFVSTDDVHALVRLCTAIARSTDAPESSSGALRERLEKRAADYLARFPSP